MERVALGADVTMSRIVYGMWRLADDSDTSPAHVQAKIESCLAQGITTMDQADIYGGYMAEEVLGNALRGTGLRDQIEIVTKCDIVAPAGRHAAAVAKYKGELETTKSRAARAEAEAAALREELAELNSSFPDFVSQPGCRPRRPGLRDAQLESAQVQPVPDPFEFQAALHLVPGDGQLQDRQDQQRQHQASLGVLCAPGELAVVAVEQDPQRVKEADAVVEQPHDGPSASAPPVPRRGDPEGADAVQEHLLGELLGTRVELAAKEVELMILDRCRKRDLALCYLSL